MTMFALRKNVTLSPASPLWRLSFRSARPPAALALAGYIRSETCPRRIDRLLHILSEDFGSYAPCEQWCYPCPKVRLGSNGPYIISEHDKSVSSKLDSISNNGHFEPQSSPLPRFGKFWCKFPERSSPANPLQRLSFKLVAPPAR